MLPLWELSRAQRESPWGRDTAQTSGLGPLVSQAGPGCWGTFVTPHTASPVLTQPLSSRLRVQGMFAPGAPGWL